ncbi:hypothetical protein COLO4_23313 [Corchorus olitorius]|uniref:Protein kinase domain-containing protein n=1 Tax=Corchorus olitorius TaxID=93759 RepID=A0A1R3IHE0_9ROSI|nr:hypothetical protein COLO4_23313 [Corchorus olitorius]
MTTRKRRESTQRALVVLKGDRVSSDKTGLAPLWRAYKYASNVDDEILILILLSGNGSGPSSSKGFRGDHQCNSTCEEDPYIKSMRQEISQRKEDYRQIFRPFYELLKGKGVKFQVNIAAGIKPKDIITEEANNAGATWIILDSYFTRHLTFRLSGTESNVSLVSDHLEDNDIAPDRLFTILEEPESSMSMEEEHNPISSTSQAEPSRPITTRETEDKTIYEPQYESRRQVEQTRTGNVPSNDNNISTRVSMADFMAAEKPQKLSWEVIVQITKWFSTKAWNNDPDRNYSTHIGYFQNQSVLVQRLLSCRRRIFEAEMRAASSMHHKNIMILTGYHRSENGTILIFPFLQGMTSIDRYIWGPGRRELKFQAKLDIAISIAQGLRYMHEECPQGPIVHGDLQPWKILLGRDLQPMISGFGKAKWLQLELVSLNSKNRHLVAPSVVDSIALVKNDVLQFGVLLLRLFCLTSAPEDDKSLIEWARPLMLKRKFHELLDEDLNCSDMHGIYRVMAAATACTRSKPISRPYMTQVICLLKGEKFCAIQTSPSDSSF